MSSIHDFSTIPPIWLVDIVIIVSIILYITGIAPVFFVALVSVILVGAIVSTI